MEELSWTDLGNALNLGGPETPAAIRERVPASAPEPEEAPVPVAPLPAGEENVAPQLPNPEAEATEQVAPVPASEIASAPEPEEAPVPVAPLPESEEAPAVVQTPVPEIAALPFVPESSAQPEAPDPVDATVQFSGRLTTAKEFVSSSGGIFPLLEKISLEESEIAGHEGDSDLLVGSDASKGKLQKELSLSDDEVSRLEAVLPILKKISEDGAAQVELQLQYKLGAEMAKDALKAQAKQIASERKALERTGVGPFKADSELTKELNGVKLFFENMGDVQVLEEEQRDLEAGIDGPLGGYLDKKAREKASSRIFAIGVELESLASVDALLTRRDIPQVLVDVFSAIRDLPAGADQKSIDAAYDFGTGQTGLHRKELYLGIAKALGVEPGQQSAPVELVSESMEAVPVPVETTEAPAEVPPAETPAQRELEEIEARVAALPGNMTNAIYRGAENLAKTLAGAISEGRSIDAEKVANVLKKIATDEAGKTQAAGILIEAAKLLAGLPEEDRTKVVGVLKQTGGVLETAGLVGTGFGGILDAVVNAVVDELFSQTGGR